MERCGVLRCDKAFHAIASFDVDRCLFDHVQLMNDDNSSGGIMQRMCLRIVCKVDVF